MASTPSTMAPLGMTLPPFSLVDEITGSVVSSADFGDAPALLVMFLCNHCPFVKHVRVSVAELVREYAPRGLQAVAFASNDLTAYPQDGPDGMRDEAREAGYPFPYLFDETQAVAKAFQAACTPDFFLFGADGRLAYRGQFDGSRPTNGVPVTGEDLRKAVEAVLMGSKPSEAQRPSIGCNIKWKKGNAPDYFG